MAEVDKRIGENLRRIRKSKRVGQIELSKLSGVSQGGISAIELGKREAYPSTLERLADALDVPVAAFFQKDGDGPDSLTERTNAELDRLHEAHAAGEIDTETFVQRTVDLSVLYAHEAGLSLTAAEARAARAREERLSREAG